MPIQPNFLERTAFFTMNAAPAPMLDLVGALAYQVLSTAVHLNIFNILQERPSTAVELANTLESHERGTKRLLQALAAIKYIEERNGRYHNTAMTQKWFLDGEELDMVSAVTCWDRFLGELWPTAPQVVQSGQRPFDFYPWVAEDPAFSHAFQQMMVGNANLTGPDIIKKLNLPPNTKKLLDVGGGHGAFSVQFCKALPNLSATIIDSAAALKTAAMQVSANQLDDRITLSDGDFWDLDWGQNHDVILLFNVLHHFDAKTNLKLLQKAKLALKSGGIVAILEQVEGDVFGSASQSLVSLIGFMYYLFADGRTFSQEDLMAILTDAGFENPRMHKIRKAPGHGLFTAVA